MGFNATRRYRDGKGTDIAILISGVAITVALVLWAVGVLG
jgi:hypothetical protein